MTPQADNLQRVHFTLDLEDHRPDDSYPKRYPTITRTVLEFLKTRRLRATVFVLGRLAREEPALIQEISDAGHEIAYHSAGHVHLPKDDEATFRRETERDVEFLSDLIGRDIIGYRAPAFSLTPKALWALAHLKEMGFQYSSSVLPVANPINGFPGAPRQPFRWPNGLLEIPAPVANLGPIDVPFLGGFYFRYLPLALVKRWVLASTREQALWIYCHPHDFDHQERFFQIEGTSLIVSLLLWFNRKGTLAKLERLMSTARDERAAQTFSERLDAGDFDLVPSFEPGDVL